MNLNTISDEQLREAYVARFTIPAGDPIRSLEAAADHFRGFLADDVNREIFIVCFLNGQNQLLTTEILFRGSLTSSAVYPREVVSRVLTNQAASVIFAHNHPSGAIRPSTHDRKVTEKLKQALDAIDVRVLDHVILGGDEAYSFAEAGLL